MNAIIYFFFWLASFFGHQDATINPNITPVGQNNNTIEARGVDQINVNPRTVVALEDTHYNPCK